MSNNQQKRKYSQQDDIAGTMDDLAFAATFAIVEDEQESKENLTEKEGATDDTDSNEDGSSDESLNVVGDKNEMRGEENGDSDDESDVDLSEQLAKMEDEDKPKSKNSRIVVPTTQNEIDLYNCPVNDLEKKLNLDLGISDILLFHPSDTGIMNAKVASDRIRLAGHIKFHLQTERTIVVESEPTIASNNPAQFGGVPQYHIQQQPMLLDEGSLLLLSIKEDDEITSKLVRDMKTEANKSCVIPLGKILEVFGPVSKPLYTIRLMNSSVKAKTNTQEETDDIKLEEEVSNDVKEEGGDSIEVKKEVSEIESSIESSIEKPVINTSSTKVKSESKPKMLDPWAKDGVLSKWIKSNPRLEVYYTEDQVKMMDTVTIARNSRKGCDASNIYDEEVTDGKDMYFSDDEEERMVKRGKKKNKNQGVVREGGGAFRSGGGRGNVPQNYQPRQHSHYAQNPNYGNNYPSMSNVPPPPPPPPSYNQQHPVYFQQAHVPPPPGVPNYPNYPPPQNGMYYNQMQYTAGTNNVPPPPPPQQYHNANTVLPQQQVPQQQQTSHPYPPPQYANQQYQQYHQQPNQGNNQNVNGGDTVYYNYSGS